jgi:hypothetical protein
MTTITPSSSRGSSKNKHPWFVAYLVPVVVPIVIALIGLAGVGITAYSTQKAGEIQGRLTAIAELKPTIDALETRAAIPTPQINTPIVSHLNRLVAFYDFEGKDDGWSKISSKEVGEDGTSKSIFPDNPLFPGFMTSKVSTDYALTGQSSLKVTTSVNIPGTFMSFLRRQGTFTGSGATIYMMTPNLTNASIEYVQLCIPSHGWVCADGVKLVPGEWRPITIDLSQYYKDVPLYKQELNEIAVQWKFNTKAGTSLDLYFDSAEIFSSGQ